MPNPSEIQRLLEEGPGDTRIAFNRTELTLENMTHEECAELQLLAEDVVLRGRSAGGHWMFEYWRCEAGFDPRQALLVMATVFPQRALLSVTRHLRRTK